MRIENEGAPIVVEEVVNASDRLRGLDATVEILRQSRAAASEELERGSGLRSLRRLTPPRGCLPFRSPCVGIMITAPFGRSW